MEGERRADGQGKYGVVGSAVTQHCVFESGRRGRTIVRSFRTAGNISSAVLGGMVTATVRGPCDRRQAGSAAGRGGGSNEGGAAATRGVDWDCALRSMGQGGVMRRKGWGRIRRRQRWIPRRALRSEAAPDSACSRISLEEVEVGGRIWERIREPIPLRFGRYIGEGMLRRRPHQLGRLIQRE
jgi:hypothetical protein